MNGSSDPAKSSKRQPSLQEQITFYDEWNARWRAKSFDDLGEENMARGNAVLNALSSLSLSRPAIIEVGCGTGWLTERLVPFGEVSATDMSPQAIAIARQRGIEATFEVGDFYQIPLPIQHYDVAICVETITSVPDQPRFIGKIASLLKPRGYLIITAVNKFVYQRRGDVGPPKPGQIRKWLSRQELHQLVKRDFHIIKSTTVLPRGDRGIMRAVGSYKINKALSLFFSDGTIARAKEKLGFGHCRVITSQLRDRTH